MWGDQVGGAKPEWLADKNSLLAQTAVSAEMDMAQVKQLFDSKPLKWIVTSSNDKNACLDGVLLRRERECSVHLALALGPSENDSV
jgi:hypothetical protein